MRGPAKLATYIGIGMVAMGFLLIFLAWDNAAELDRLPEQFPWMLSGGIGGLGLIIAGMAVIAIQAQRTITAERIRDMARVQAEADALLFAVAPELAAALEPELHAVSEPAAPDSTRDRSERPAGGFAPASREAPAAAAGQQEPAGVATLEAQDEAWAPPQRGTAAAESEQARIEAALADVSGVGEAKRTRLQERFGTYEALAGADVEELAAVPGVSRTLAERIHQALR